MKKTIFYILLFHIFTANICAQEVTLFKQHDMKKWNIPAGNYSGISFIEGNQYALVSDKQPADGWMTTEIHFLPSCDIDKMQFISQHYKAQTSGNARDSEGIVYVPGKGFFICAENDQQILRISEEGASNNVRLSVPAIYRSANIFPNYGFESLAYNRGNGIFWVTTEQGLKTDVMTPSSPASPKPTLLRIQSFGSDMQPLHQYAYKTEAPVTKRNPRYYAFGVSEMLAVNDSTLLVMERELNIPQRYNRAECIINIYSVNPLKHQPITETSMPLHEMDASVFLPKKLVCAFRTGFRIFGKKNLANYEGMCMGPKQSDGSQTILLIADSQGRAGKSLFHLKDYIRVMKINLSI